MFYVYTPPSFFLIHPYLKKITSNGKPVEHADNPLSAAGSLISGMMFCVKRLQPQLIATDSHSRSLVEHNLQGL